MPTFTETIVIKAPLEGVYELISNFERYPQILPGCKNAEVVAQTKTRAEVVFTVHVVKTIQYTLEYKLTPPKAVSWKFLEGEVMTDNSGWWKLEKKSAQETEATFHLNLEFPFWIPKSMIQKNVEEAMPKMLKHLKKMAETEATKIVAAKKKVTKK